MNDKLMIQNAGIGIAMGQSTPRIKEIADYVTEDNDNDGISNLEEFEMSSCTLLTLHMEKSSALRFLYTLIRSAPNL